MREIAGGGKARAGESERLGWYRWVMERALAWLYRFRRLEVRKVRYERRADIHQVFLSLGCALICWKALGRSYGVGYDHCWRLLMAGNAHSSGSAR
jgi:hypothetical protein